MKVKKINVIKNYYYIKKVKKKKKLKIGLEPFLFLFLFDNSVITMRERRSEPWTSPSKTPGGAN